MRLPHSEAIPELACPRDRHHFAVPKPFPQEFRATSWGRLPGRPDGVTLERVAAVIGFVRCRCRSGCVRPGSGTRPGQTKKRIRLLEQENEVLRRAAAYFGHANLSKAEIPLVGELAADRVPVWSPVGNSVLLASPSTAARRAHHWRPARRGLSILRPRSRPYELHPSRTRDRHDAHRTRRWRRMVQAARRTGG